MSYFDPENPAAWDEYCEFQDRELKRIMQTTTCGQCLHCPAPSEDGFKGFDKNPRWCKFWEIYTDPNELAADIPCEEVVLP